MDLKRERNTDDDEPNLGISGGIGNEKKRKVLDDLPTGSTKPTVNTDDDSDDEVPGGDWEKRDDGSYWDPIIGTWAHDGEDEEREFEDCNNENYHYQDSEAFLAALELYNREGCKTLDAKVYGNPTSAIVPTHDWECHKVAGSHRKGCGSCGTSFAFSPYSSTRTYYLTDRLEGSEKMCLSCMDGLLNDRYGTDKATIKAQLAGLRQKQGPSSSIGNYEARYIDYQVFLAHCKENDQEGAHTVETALAHRVNAAMNRAFAM